jgi:hypothetical protein
MEYYLAKGKNGNIIQYYGEISEKSMALKFSWFMESSGCHIFRVHTLKLD